MNNYNELNILNNCKKVCLIGHIEPDPDAISSMIVFCNFIKHHFKVDEVDMFAETKMLSENVKLILNNNKINPDIKSYDIAIMMDCPNTARLGKYGELFIRAKTKIVIDHHATNTFDGDINIVEICSSTCEIIYSICKHFNYEISNDDQGRLYAGLIADTNNFAVGAISGRTFEIAAQLTKNIDRDKIYTKFLASKALKNMQMLSLAIQNIISLDNNQIIISHISKNEALKNNAGHNDFFGIVNNLATIENSKLICFIEPREENYYASMRANSGYDVSIIAKNNGGGGHVGAAAFSSNKDLDQLITQIIEEFKKQLNQQAH